MHIQQADSQVLQSLHSQDLGTLSSATDGLHCSALVFFSVVSTAQLLVIG